MLQFSSTKSNGVSDVFILEDASQLKPSARNLRIVAKKQKNSMKPVRAKYPKSIERI